MAQNNKKAGVKKSSPAIGVDISESMWGHKDIFSILLLLCFMAIVFVTPFLRGIFFDEDLLPWLVFAGIVMVLAIIDQFRQRKLRFIRSYSDIAMLIYGVSYAIAYFTAVIPRKSVIGAVLALSLFAVYWMASNLVENDKQRKLVASVLMIAAVGVVLVSLDSALNGLFKYPAAFQSGRIYSTWQYPNSGGTHMTAFLVIALACMIKAGKLWERALYLAAASILCMGIIGTVSKGAILITLAGLFLLFLLFDRRSKILLVFSSGISLVLGTVAWKAFISSYSSHQTFLAVFTIVTLVIVSFGLAYVWEMVLRRFSTLDETIMRQVKWAGIAAAFIAVIILGATWRLWIPQDIITRLAELKDWRTNQSFVTRYDFARWAVAIIKDHPLSGTGYGGWNGLYQRYQDYSYWTTETHSHFLQVGVEAGLIGLFGYLAVWLLHVIRTIRVRFKDLLSISIGVAALILFIHSSFDFDFSIPGLQVIAWALVGLLGSLMTDTFNVNLTAKINKIVAIPISIVLIIGLAVSTSLWHGFNLTVEARTLGTADINANIRTVMDDYVSASKYDIWANEPLISMGRMYASMASRDKQFAAPAMDYTKQAEELSLYDVRSNTAIAQNYQLLGDYQGVVRMYSRRIEQVPMDGSGYEALIQSYVEAAENAALKKDYKQAREYARQALEVPDLIRRAQAKVNPTRVKYAVGQKIVITDKIRFYSAIANYVLGNTEQTRTIIGRLQNVPSFKNDVALLQASIYHRAGKPSEAQSLVRSVYALDDLAWAKFNMYNRLRQ